MAGSRRKVRRVAGGLAAMLATALPVVATPEPAAAEPTLSVSATGLVDFQPVQVTGSGFEPGALLEIFQCRGGAVDEFDCDPSNAFFVDVDQFGDIDIEFYVDARIYTQDLVEVDCRTDPAGCEIGVGFLLDAGEWPEVALDFDPDAPLKPAVTGDVDPDTDLVDGQVVQLAGHNLSPREETVAIQCAAGDEELGRRCDIDRLARGVPDAAGDATGEMNVYTSFRTPLGGEVDCLDPDTSCVIEIHWGFDPPPDRRTAVPIGFRGPEPPPTTPTTPTTQVPPSTTSPATTAPTGTAPPAQPVAGRPTFTG